MGRPILLLEASGALVGIAGGIICSKDNSAGTNDGEVAYPYAMSGNLIALSASFGTAAYLAIARDLRSKYDLFVYMWTIFFLSSFFVLAFMIATNEPVEFSRHPDYGLFGWMNPTRDRLPVELFMAVVVNVIGSECENMLIPPNSTNKFNLCTIFRKCASWKCFSFPPIPYLCVLFHETVFNDSYSLRSSFYLFFSLSQSAWVYRSVKVLRFNCCIGHYAHGTSRWRLHRFLAWG